MACSLPRMAWFGIFGDMTVPTLEEIRALIEARERAAYQKGWSDAVTRLLAAAKVEAVPASETGTLVAKRPIGAPKPSRPIVQVILDVIKEKPGLRGAEIFREAVNRVGGSVGSSPGRTRMRIRAPAPDSQPGAWSSGRHQP